MDEKDFISRRSPLLGLRGAVASSQPLASEAGLRILQKGGTAADAAVAMAAALNICEPCSTGLGGDAFLLWYDAKLKTVESIQGNGRSPAGLTLELVQGRGYTSNLPLFDALTVTVPGAAALWVDAVEKYGSLPLREVLEPAIELAENGWPVPPVTAHQWGTYFEQLKQGGEHAKDLLYEGNRPPKAGEVMRNPNLANTFRLLASHGKRGFYEGDIAAAIVEVLKERGGVMTMEDLSSHSSAFAKPISTLYRSIRVWEIPPPCQGITVLNALNILETFQSFSNLKMGSPEHVHLLIEAVRLALSDSLTHVADPDHHEALPLDRLLSKQYGKKRAECIGLEKAMAALPGDLNSMGSDTVYFCAVDAQGNACSMINSNYWGFGTGIVPKGCGFSLQNRGHNFSLNPNHPNCLAPCKRPFHTIIPGLTTKPTKSIDSETESTGSENLHTVFGVMGGFMQPQGHVQVLTNLIDFDLNPQSAIDFPRFCVSGLPCLEKGHGPHPLVTSRVDLESGPGRVELARKLTDMGHHVTLVEGSQRSTFGKSQIIFRDEKTGVLWAGSEGRADGCAMVW